MAFRESNPAELGSLFDGMIAGIPKNQTLATIKAIVDWKAVRRAMAPMYKDPRRGGTPGYDPVIMVRLLLLEHLYGLSDVQVSAEASDRYTFRDFLDLGPGKTVPDDTTISLFRQRLIRFGLEKKVFRQVNTDLARAGFSVRKGAMKVVDATLIASAATPEKMIDEDNIEDTATNCSSGDDPVAPSPEPEEEPCEEKPCEGQGRHARRAYRDREADWTVKGGTPVHGYKLHAAQDRATGLITEYLVTRASVHDSNVFEQLLDGTESAVLADKAYGSEERRRALFERGTLPLIQSKRKRGSSPLSRTLTELNKLIGNKRGVIEGTFGGLKRWRRLGRAISVGLARMRVQAAFAIAAANLLTYANTLRRLQTCALK
jgi:transposase, IS5 family